MEETFGRYTLLRRLAVGGMAEIFLAALHGDAGFEKKVVVKRILPHLGQDADFVKMFIDEAVVAARLTHPNIVQVHDFGSEEGSYYIAMEYIDGLDLHRLLRQVQASGRRLSPAEVATLGEGIARGLSYTHNLTDDAGTPLGIVHRDVSPHNVILSVTGDVKVMDFGIAKAAARATRTATGTIKGKLAYMSPEQAMGKSATKWSDQFALGVVLWECLTGQRLFVSDTDVNLIQTVIACEIPSLRGLRPDVPEALEAIIMRALQKDPADRFPDLSDMEAALTAFHFTLGANGIVNVGQLAKTLRSQLGDVSTWSWADRNSPVGTRPVARPTHNGTPATNSEASTPRPTGPLLSAAMGAQSDAMLTPRPSVRVTGTVSQEALQERPARKRSRDLRTTIRIDRSRTPWLPETVWQSRRAIFSGMLVMLIGVALPMLWWSSAAAPRPAIAASQPPFPPLAAPPTPRVGTGHLTLSTDGPAVNVYLGGTCLGQTPLADEEVPAGRLELRLVNERAGIWRSFEIEVPEGGVARGQISSR